MTKKKGGVFRSKFAMGVIFVVAAIYAIYHLGSLFSGDGIKTIESGVTTHTVSVSASGYIFRDEKMLTVDNSGVVDYVAADGSKVAIGDEIANVYKGNSADRENVMQLDRQIAVLERSAIGSEPLDYGALRSEANDIYNKISGMLASDETGELAVQVEEMMVTLNRMSAMKGEDKELEQALNTLKAVREGYFKGSYETGYAPSSGYFYYTADGYEGLFTDEAVESLSEESFGRLVALLDAKKGSVSAKVFGKLASDSSWHFVVPLSAEDAESFDASESCNILFPANNAQKLPMTLEKKLETKNGDEVLCVFYCNRLPNNFSFERCQSVEIEVSSDTGIYVPRSALTRVDGILGVYVRRGSVVHFRRIEVIYQGVDFCLADEHALDEGGYYALDTNELIIYEGKNLFDGRILE